MTGTWKRYAYLGVAEYCGSHTPEARKVNNKMDVDFIISSLVIICCPHQFIGCDIFRITNADLI